MIKQIVRCDVCQKQFDSVIDVNPLTIEVKIRNAGREYDTLTSLQYDLCMSCTKNAYKLGLSKYDDEATRFANILTGMIYDLEVKE